MSRPVAGLACRIRVPVRQYEAVAVLMRDTRHVIRLLHRDAGLSIDVEEFDTFETAEDYGDRLASFLNLPAMMMAGAPGTGAARKPAASRRRRGLPVRGRRPRFLMRRRPGGDGATEKVEGREIIARN